MPPATRHRRTPSHHRTSRVSPATFLRSAVAAGGSVAGAVAAVPLGALLATALFTHVGMPIMEGILSGGVADDLDVVQRVIATIMLVIVAVVIALIVVCALVAPVFVVLPMLGTALALWVSRAGLILRTLWLALAFATVFAVAVVALLSALDERMPWWVWLGIVAVAAFLGRLTVELWQPERAGRRMPIVATRRWLVLGIVWVCLLVVAAVGAVTLFFSLV